MARKAAGLTALEIKNMKPGKHADEPNLYLLMRPNGWKGWQFRYKINGKAREMGLGPLLDVPAPAARQKAADLRKLLVEGIDPIDQKNAIKGQAAAEAQRQAILAKTFKDVADTYLTNHESSWSNPKHRQQWRSTLETYVFPVVGDIGVGQVSTDHIKAILEPIWREKTETAKRVRGRIETILDYAKSSGWREGENPARWRGHFKGMLPSPGKLAPVEHHPALPWREIAPFIAALHSQPGMGAIALRFAILTAARTGEVLGCVWSEISLSDAAWIIPGARMKAGREHRVPLSAPAVALLRALNELRTDASADAVVFPNSRGNPLSNMTMLKALKLMERGDVTTHGFRSTFRDWVAEATNYPTDIAEAALAHTIGDKVQAAYQRSDLFEKRRKLMDDWAEFCYRPA